MNMLKLDWAAFAIEPVVLPGNELNHHLGWPVAAMSRGVLLVVYYRQPCHWGRDVAADANTSRAVLVRSTDGGNTWSAPLDMRALVKTPTPMALSFGNSLGVLPDGTVVLVTQYGVFRWTDAGATWTHLPARITGVKCNHGPNLLYHPTKGLVVAAHDVESKSNPLAAGRVPAVLRLRYSTDAGETGREERQDLPADFVPVETALAWHDGMLVALARNHAFSAEVEGVWHYAQLTSASGWLPVTARQSNVVATDANRRHADTPVPAGFKLKPDMGAWTQDTADVAFNPMRQRIEAVVTDRNGAAGLGAGNTRDRQTLGLWSIAPAELRAGKAEWRYDGTLLRRTGIAHLEQLDGLHPGGAVMDVERGVQHIFIYAAVSRQ